VENDTTTRSEPVVDPRLYGAFAAAGRVVLQATTRHQVHQTLTQVLTDEVDFDGAVVWMLPDGPDTEISEVASAGELVDATRAAARDAVDRALVDGETVVLPAAGGSVCAVPLRCGLEVRGVLVTTMATVDGHDPPRLHLLERLGVEAASALGAIAARELAVGSRLARSAVQVELAGRVEMQAALARIGQMALAGDAIEVLFAEIVESAWRLLNVDFALVEEVLVDGRLGVAAGAGSGGWRPATRLDRATAGSFTRRVLDDAGPVWVEDLKARDDDQIVTAAPAARSAAGVAIRPRSEQLCALVVANRVPRRWAADEVDFLRSLANVAATALERIEAGRQLIEQALHDPLTGLPNRTLLHDRLAAATDALGRGRVLAVLLVDLDGFKLVNDALGHDVGDQLLVAVADRLREVVRGGDTVARLGGDEFAVLCPDLPDAESADDVAERLNAAMTAPFELESAQTFITASIGITLRDRPGASPRTLLREADAAMYVAKEGGRAGHEVFDDSMRLDAVRRLEMTNDLCRALEREELELVWHPIVDLIDDDGRQEISLEALVRWRHPEHGLVRPDAFIGLAEDTGLIRPLGEWVLRAAARQLAEWQAAEPDGCPDLISVNLSAHQLARPSFVDLVDDVFLCAGVDTSTVELEVTETALMGDPVHAIDRLRDLRRRGFRIAIDDFGTGYSSMSYLRDLPASALKVDRSFVARLELGGTDRSIVEAIIGLAHAVGLVAVAEGVETAEQLAILRSMGCDRAQGFLWTEPLAPGEVPRWIASQRTATAALGGASPRPVPRSARLAP
jgi:diguanylate cyclase (GGDEF)-like protein